MALHGMTWRDMTCPFVVSAPPFRTHAPDCVDDLCLDDKSQYSTHLDLDASLRQLHPYLEVKATPPDIRA